MKKFAMAAVAALSLSTVSAETCASSFSGFYAGAQLGVNSTTGTLSTDNLKAGTVARGNADFKTTTGKKSFLGGIFAGYGMGVGSCAYVGAEFYGNFGSTGNTLIDTSGSNAADKNFTVKAKNTLAFGAKVRLGYTVSQQAMVFVGLGLEYAKWALTAENLGAAQTVEETTKGKTGKVHFAPSVGMDMFLSKNLFVRGEYTYVLAAKGKVSPLQGTVAANTTATMKVNMSQQRFALGLGYKF
jgi:opacity protein-like surface antigen